MDDGMNDDVAASRTTPSEQAQQKPDSKDRRMSGGHFHGFREQPKSHGILSKEGKIGKYFATHGGGEQQGESKTDASGKHIDRSEMYGGYGA